jgi:hypothetical protein
MRQMIMRLDETKSVDVWTALKYLEELETKLADIYELMSKTFSEDKEADQLFTRLKRMERVHVKMIDFQIRLVTAERNSFDNVKMDIYGIKKSLTMAESLLRSLKDMTLDEAIENLLVVNEYACDRCFRDTIVLANPSLEKMMTKMNVSDQGLTDSIKAFAENRGII